MNNKIIFRPAAENDLIEIYTFIAQNNPTAAIGIVRKVRSHCLTLTTMAERGVPREHLGSGIRLLIIERKITVAYRVEPGLIHVMRIFYAGQNIPDQLTDDADL